MPFENSTLFSVLFTMILKKRCIDAPKYAFTHRNLSESEKYIELFKMKSLDSFILASRDN